MSKISILQVLIFFADASKSDSFFKEKLKYAEDYYLDWESLMEKVERVCLVKR